MDSDFLKTLSNAINNFESAMKAKPSVILCDLLSYESWPSTIWGIPVAASLRVPVGHWLIWPIMPPTARSIADIEKRAESNGQ